MELPSIGKHCSDATCSQLDFLPYSCPYCKQIFCQDHWRLEGHVCPKKDDATLQDQRVPICPLCDKPVPVKKGENPNLRMEQHIAAGCPEPATTTSKPIYTNSCNAKGCKNRSAIPIICQKCRLNYCLKHRLEGDHACPSLNGNGNSNGNGNGKANGSGSKPTVPAKTSGTSHGHNWSQKAANAARNARSSSAAAAATNRQRQSQSRPSNTSSSGKKDKDKCLIS